MVKRYLPEGGYMETAANKNYLSDVSGLERAMNEGAIIEGIATLCDETMRLHVDLHCAHGVIDAEEAVYCRAGESRKDIAVITRVGKPVACKILSIEHKNGSVLVHLSRRAAQKACMDHYLSELRGGDTLYARVTHLEPFGAFMDIGCGVSSLLSVDCISVSRISHPADRLSCGMLIPVAVKYVHTETEHIYVTLKELLGTWEQNVACFEAGQTVTGIIRSVEDYGVFVELTPNLAGLAEVREDQMNDWKECIGKKAAVYIKSIVPERMKIKLVLIDSCCREAAVRMPMRYYILPEETPHLSAWTYSPSGSRKLVETLFDTDLQKTDGSN